MGTFKISNNMYGRSTDERISFALCSLMFLPAINNLINSLLQIGFSIYLEFLTPCAYIFMAFLSVFVLYKHILRKRSFLFFFLILFFGVMITYLAYPEIQRVLYKSPVDLVYSPVNKLFFYCIPALIGVACLYDADVLFDRMCIWARFTCALGILTFYYIFFITGKTLQYMVYSYFMLLPICVCYEQDRKSVV